MVPSPDRRGRHQPSVVVPYQAQRRGWFRALLAILLIITLVAAYWLGGVSLRHQYTDVREQRDALRVQLEALQQTAQSQQQDLINLQMASEVDRQTVKQVRGLIREQKQQLAELTEENAFYKGLMAPSERERGLSIRSWEVYPAATPNRYQFKLVVQQLTLKHLLLTGVVQISIAGTQDGQPREYALSELSDDFSERGLKLRFKYFQNIEGELSLPEGFQAKSVTLLAKAQKPKASQLEKSYDWIVEGGEYVE